MYRYIIKNKGLYSVYAILLVVSSTMSVFFAFVLSEIMNCAAEGNCLLYTSDAADEL